MEMRMSRTVASRHHCVIANVTTCYDLTLRDDKNLAAIITQCPLHAWHLSNLMISHAAQNIPTHAEFHSYFLIEGSGKISLRLYANVIYYSTSSFFVYCVFIINYQL